MKTAVEPNEQSDADDLDRLVAAFVRIRGVDRLEDAIITRCWLAADMRVSQDRLDRLLKLLRWQRLIDLPNEHLVTVVDAPAMRALALERQEVEARSNEGTLDRTATSLTPPIVHY